MRGIAVVPSAKEIQLVELPRPEMRQPTDILLRVLEVGVCGTDKEICAFEYGTPPPRETHLVIGHEALAEVLEVGSAVRGLAVGDLVVPMVRRPCEVAACVPCRASRQDFCVTGEYSERGIQGRHGFMSDFLVEEERYLRPVPPELRDVAILAEPLTIAEKALFQIDLIQQRLPWACAIGGASGDRSCRTVVVLGAGPVGLLGAMAFRLNRYRVIVVSREAEGSGKARLVESFGGEYVSTEATPAADLAERCGPIDVIYEAVGASSLAFEAMSALGTNGIFVFTGVPGRKGRVDLDTDALMRRLVLANQVVLGTVNAGEDAFDAAIEDLRRMREAFPRTLQDMLQRHPVQRYRQLLLEGGPAVKNVISFGE